MCLRKKNRKHEINTGHGKYINIHHESFERSKQRTGALLKNLYPSNFGASQGCRWELFAWRCFDRWIVQTCNATCVVTFWYSEAWGTSLDMGIHNFSRLASHVSGELLNSCVISFQVQSIQIGTVDGQNPAPVRHTWNIVVIGMTLRHPLQHFVRPKIKLVYATWTTGPGCRFGLPGCRQYRLISPNWLCPWRRVMIRWAQTMVTWQPFSWRFIYLKTCQVCINHGHRVQSCEWKRMFRVRWYGH